MLSCCAREGPEVVDGDCVEEPAVVVMMDVVGDMVVTVDVLSVEEKNKTK